MHFNFLGPRSISSVAARLRLGGGSELTRELRIVLVID